MNSSGWSQTLCKEEMIETTLGDNEPGVSVMRSKKVYGELLVLPLLTRETLKLVVLSVELLDTGLEQRFGTTIPKEFG